MNNTFYYAENQVFETMEKANESVKNMPAARIWAHDFNGSFKEFEAEFEQEGSNSLDGGKQVVRLEVAP